MGQLYIRILLRHFLYDLAPQAGGIQYVRLIHADYLVTTLSGDLKALDRDTADLILIISQSIGCLLHTVHFLREALAEIQTAGQLSHDLRQ